MRSLLFTGVLTLTTLANSDFVMGKTIECKSDEISVPDDREQGGNLCLSVAELDQAKKNCNTTDTKEAMQCVCQDGDQVGACGD